MLNVFITRLFLFSGDDYKQHTQCVSENEKYGGKGYQAPQSANKGEAKQEQWLQVMCLNVWGQY